MNRFEKLVSETPNSVIIDEKHHFNGNLSGLYVDGNIALSDKLETSSQKACVLAEELGHHHTTVGNILDPSNPSNRKQERRARLWGFNHMIGLYGLVSALEHGCRSKQETANFLEVTEEYLEEAIKCYKEIYGLYAKADNYIIYFEPCLKIIKMI